MRDQPVSVDTFYRIPSAWTGTIIEFKSLGAWHAACTILVSLSFDRSELMKAVGLITLLAGLTLGSQAHALVIPVSEPNMLSLLGLGGLIAVLVVRYLRR